MLIVGLTGNAEEVYAAAERTSLVVHMRIQHLLFERITTSPPMSIPSLISPKCGICRAQSFTRLRRGKSMKRSSGQRVEWRKGFANVYSPMYEISVPGILDATRNQITRQKPLIPKICNLRDEKNTLKVLPASHSLKVAVSQDNNSKALNPEKRSWDLGDKV
eukprot:767081-Hanusia_phi.AAC.3